MESKEVSKKRKLFNIAVAILVYGGLICIGVYFAKGSPSFLARLQ